MTSMESSVTFNESKFSFSVFFGEGYKNWLEDCLSSEEIICNNNRWKLHICTLSSNNLFLCGLQSLTNNQDNLRTDFKLFIVDDENESTIFESEGQTGVKMMNDKVSEARWMVKEENSGVPPRYKNLYLKDLVSDTLKIKVDISLHSLVTNNKKIVHNKPGDWKESFIASHFNENTTDCVIIAGVGADRTRIPCHKYILSFFSPVFTAMFENQMQESVTNEIVISDFNSKHVEMLVKTMDTNSFDCIDDSSENVLIEMLKLAHKYEVTSVLNYTINALVDLTTVDNCVDMLILADTYSLNELKERLLEYFNFQFMKIIKVHKNLLAEKLGETLFAEVMKYVGEH